MLYKSRPRKEVGCIAWYIINTVEGSYYFYNTNKQDMLANMLWEWQHKYSQIQFLIQSFNKCLLCAYCMPGTVLGTGEKAMQQN